MALQIARAMVANGIAGMVQRVITGVDRRQMPSGHDQAVFIDEGHARFDMAFTGAQTARGQLWPWGAAVCTSRCFARPSLIVELLQRPGRANQLPYCSRGF
ncbi:MAG: hypothetical protein MUF76_07680, partial [Hydrogenophaga sp.]|nr:hypothetical protein [Hydrogenophaga sp.]